jgi:DNA repair protein RadC
MTIRSWPSHERPREKLLNKGPGSLSDAELLAIFLRTGVAGQSAVDIARRLLMEFGNLAQLFNAKADDLMQSKGIGTAKYVQLQAVLEIARRYLYQGIEQGKAINSPAVLADFLRAKMRGYQQEVFACLFLNSQHRAICFKELFQGTINGTAVHPREIARMALSYNAAAVILAHNHPSGEATPSNADRQVTKRIQEALDLVDVRVLDHMVVGDTEVTSMAELGWL